jgi:hypothetical protein
MMATFSTADWRGAALEIADALAILALSASPPLSDPEATSSLQSAASRLVRAMREKDVSEPAIEYTIGLVTAAVERRQIAIQSRSGAEREPGQVQTGSGHAAT